MEYLPRTPQEHRVADQIAQNYWRLLRCRRMETGAMDLHLSTLKDKLKVDPKAPVNNDTGIFLCMQENPKDFDLLRRYESAIEKAWYRAIRELRIMQKERRKLEAEQVEEEAYNPPLEDTIAERPMAAASTTVTEPQERTNKAKVSEIGIRCVSQPAKSENEEDRIIAPEPAKTENSSIS